MEMVDYQDDRVVIQISSTAPGLLVLNDNYYPAWRAFVDGKQTKIYLANFSFRAVPIPSGEHTVEFKYQPWGI